MKIKLLSVFVLVMVLSLMLMTTASAALPANLSWVKYASNPVVTSAVCAGVSTPTDPAIVMESANNYKMYFTTHPGTAGAQIYLATTSDGGLTWTCGNSGNPVLTLGSAGAWDETRVIAPAVIKDGATYRMWYGGRSASAVWAIGYATSSNGISWTKHPGNPVFTKGASGTWDTEMVRQPSVVLVGSTFHLFYEGTAKWPYFKIGHATSADGIAWTRDAANPVLSPTAGAWDGNEVYAPYVVMNSAVFEMFYSGNAGGHWLLGHASSSDGTTWTKDNNAIISPATSGWENGDSTDYAAAVFDSGTWKLFYSGAGSGGYRIGLATLMNQAQLTFRQLGSNVSMGGTTTIYIDVTAVTDLYGYQFQVNYDATKLNATSASFVNSFFDTTGQSIPPTWNASCVAGVCKFAVSKMAPATAVSGSGTLAQITFTPVAVGEVSLTFANNILAKIGGATITHSTTVGWVDVNGSATVSGVVALQGRATPIDAGTVTLYEVYGYAPPVTVSFNPTTGAWSTTVAVNPNSATYQISASHSLYLTSFYGDIATYTGLSVTAGGVFNAGTTTLKGGDANNDAIISVADLTCIGGDFGSDPTVSTCGGAGSPDINKDNKTNILDLVLAGGNYGLASPQPW